MLFSDPHFIDILYHTCEVFEVTELEKVVFTEYTKKDLKTLIMMGLVNISDEDIDKVTAIYTCNQNTCFVNLFSDSD